MIKVEKIRTGNLEAAIRGMRNPKKSWEKSDSFYDVDSLFDFLLDNPGMERENLESALAEPSRWYHVGDKDLALMQSLYHAGPEHRKFMRQIFVSMDITAPLYWWKEFDTYKVGTTADSESTMHTIHQKEFKPEDFSHEHLDEYGVTMLDNIIDSLNENRFYYAKEAEPLGKKDYWWQMIQLLPSSYNQKRTVTFNYENATNIIHQRKNHKLDEWREFCDILLKELPYLKEIMEEPSANQSSDDVTKNDDISLWEKSPIAKPLLKDSPAMKKFKCFDGE